MQVRSVRRLFGRAVSNSATTSTTPTALDAFTEAIAADPEHPAAYRLVAATMWISVLFRLGAVTAEDFLGQAGANAAARPKAGDIDGRFRESLDKAIALAEARLRERGRD